jgi:hypothetical protein
MSVRYNVEIVKPGEDEQQENYLMSSRVVALLLKMREGDALVINAVAGPEPGAL